MSDIFSGISKGWSDLWDTVSGQGAAKQQKEALNQAAARENASTAEYIKYLREALGVEQDFQNKALNEQSRASDQAMRLSGLGMAGNLMGQQMSLDQAIQQMLMSQAENRSNNMARQAAVQQAMPALLSMLGLSPVSVGNGYTEANPTVLGRNLLSELGTYNQAVQPMVSGMGGLGAGSAGTGATAVTSIPTAASTTTPYSMSNFNVNNLLSASPTYQFQLKQAEDAVKRSLAARGGLNSSEYTAQMANQAGNLATNETDKIYNRLASLVNYGAGGSLNASSYSQLPATNLSNLTTDVSGTLNQSAQNRSNLYSQFGQQQASTMGQIAGAQKSGSSAANQYLNQAGSVQSPSLLDTASKLYGLYTGSGGTGTLFGKNNVFGW